MSTVLGKILQYVLLLVPARTEVEVEAGMQQRGGTFLPLSSPPPHPPPSTPPVPEMKRTRKRKRDALHPERWRLCRSEQSW